MVYKHFYASLSERLKKIKIVLSDVDGVLTDAGMYYTETGDEMKKFNTRDGKGFELLRNQGYITGIITTENTEMVSRRVKKLKLDYIYQGLAHLGKLGAIEEICAKENLGLENVAYIGDDVNCMEALKGVGIAACPNDADPEVKRIAGINILKLKGGQGVFREFSALILK
nr:HAD hydrolase-like protein [Pedobacter xinjiangensis]